MFICAIVQSKERNVYSSLNSVFYSYIKWTEQTFPQGGKESNLGTLLEQVVTRFTDEKKYHNDPRYVDLWIKFVRLIFDLWLFVLLW